ncbi:MAG: LysR family transcriptional regulator [Gammaproteobacteria bacterium]|nr:LysR family transcriptional regulator [Gammaproteobacteria bacterium]
MNTDTLNAFVAVAEQGSFSRAATTLFLTQPAISKRVAQLELSLQTPLFDRVGRQVRLTEAGQVLLPRARRILAEMHDSQQAIANLAGQVGGRLRLGTSHHIGLHHLPSVLRRYTQAFPSVELDLHFLDSEEVCQAVARGELEMGVVTLPPIASPPLALFPLWRDELHIVTANNHPLVKIPTPNLHQLAEFPAILPARRTYTRDLIEQAFAAQGVSLRTTLATNPLETIKMLVSVGLGWSLLPQTLIDKDLHVFDIPHIRLTRTLGIVIHHQRTLTHAAREFHTMVSHI